ncbi:hypothetical protein BOX15_Mlig015029g3, partial [Macrostomum lignano]
YPSCISFNSLRSVTACCCRRSLSQWPTPLSSSSAHPARQQRPLQLSDARATRHRGRHNVLKALLKFLVSDFGLLGVHWRNKFEIEYIAALSNRIAAGRSLADPGLPFPVSAECVDQIARGVARLSSSQLTEVAACRGMLIDTSRSSENPSLVNFDTVTAQSGWGGKCVRFDYSDKIVGFRLNPRAPKVFRKRQCQCSFENIRSCHLRPVCHLGQKLVHCNELTQSSLRNVLQPPPASKYPALRGGAGQQILDDFIKNAFVWLLNWTYVVPVWPPTRPLPAGQELRLIPSGVTFPVGVHVLSGLNLVLVKDLLSGSVTIG